MYGKPGTGKTYLAKALASESGVNFISVKGPQLLSRFIGESEKGVRELFRLAKQSAPTILFLDEIDSLTPRRRNDGTESGVIERVISQFLTEMDGIEELKGVTVLAAINARAIPVFPLVGSIIMLSLLSNPCFSASFFSRLK